LYACEAFIGNYFCVRVDRENQKNLKIRKNNDIGNRKDKNESKDSKVFTNLIRQCNFIITC